MRPTLPSARPDWLINKHNGDMPALVHKDKTLTNPLAIAEYIEKTFPHNSLTRQGVYSYQEVLEKTAQFFPTLTAYLKNTDPARDEELGAAVEAQLDIIDGILKSTPGYYTCGIELTLADLYLAPQLFHVSCFVLIMHDCCEFLAYVHQSNTGSVLWCYRKKKTERVWWRLCVIY